MTGEGIEFFTREEALRQIILCNKKQTNLDLKITNSSILSIGRVVSCLTDLYILKPPGIYVDIFIKNI